MKVYDFELFFRNKNIPISKSIMAVLFIFMQWDEAELGSTCDRGAVVKKNRKMEYASTTSYIDAPFLKT